MVRKANQLMIAAYFSVTGYAKRLKNELMSDERGLSGVVVAVLLILIAVLAVVMLWGSLKEFLKKMWDLVTDKEGSFTGGEKFGS